MKSIYISFFLFSHVVMSQFKGLPYVKNYAPEEYGAGMQNWWIAQDTLENIYSANNQGVLIFDGTRWRLIEIAIGKKTRSLDISGDGIVYVGGENEMGYLEVDERGLLTYKSLVGKLPKDHQSFEDVWRVLCLGDHVYFQTFNEVFLYRGDSIEVIKHDSNLSFGFKFGSTIGVGDYDTGLLYYANNKWVTIPGGEFFRNKEVSSVIWNHDGWLVAAVDEGLFQLKTDGIIKQWGVGLAALGSFTRDYIIKLSNGNIALATRNNGLVILDSSGNLENYFTKGRGLNGQAVLNVFEDREGNLWCGMNDGLSKVELAGAFTYLNEEMGIQGAGYNAFNDKDNLYLSARNGLFLINPNENEIVASRLVGSETGQTFSVGRIGSDILLAAHSGAYEVESNGNLTQISDQDGWWGFVPVPVSQNLILAGTYDGLFLLENQEGRIRVQSKIEGFDESSRLFVFEDYRTLWVSHGYKGAFRLSLSEDLKTVTKNEHFGVENGFPSNTNINVFSLLDQILFTSSFGIFTYDIETDRIVPYEPLNDLLQFNTVSDLAADDLGNVYFVGKNEVGILRRNFEGSYSKDVSIFERIRPLLNDDFPSVQVIDQSSVIFGAKEGFIHFDPTSLDLNRATVNARITNLSLLSAPDSTIGESFFFITNPDFIFDFPYDHRSFRISFSSPYYSSSVTYSTQMEGLNNDQWTEWSDQTFREFTSLTEGRYLFKVKARTSSNQESEEVTINLNIAPPWYRSNWFVTLASLASVGFLVGLFLNQKRKHRSEKEEMLLTQQNVLNQKDTILQEISDKSQVEISRLEREKSSIALDHKSRELASSTMNLLQKNEMMKKIMSDLKSLKQQLDNGDNSSSKEIVRIIKNIDRNMNIEQGWDTFQMYFDEVHGDFSKKLREAYPKITPMELKLCTFIRLNMSSKDIANLLNISIRSVETNRYRFRKKLNLEHDTNLTSFIMKL